MLNATKDVTGDVTRVTLKGEIDESVNLLTLLGEPVPKMHFVLKEVNRINSMGVKAWLTYVKICLDKGTQMVLSECSPVIVEQLNLISNFAPANSVVSLYAPFSCEECNSEFVALYQAADVKARKVNLEKTKCPGCGGAAELDDSPEMFFAFLGN